MTGRCFPGKYGGGFSEVSVSTVPQIIHHESNRFFIDETTEVQQAYLSFRVAIARATHNSVTIQKRVTIFDS